MSREAKRKCQLVYGILLIDLLKININSTGDGCITGAYDTYAAACIACINDSSRFVVIFGLLLACKP
jgi:hypothetical protein